MSVIEARPVSYGWLSNSWEGNNCADQVGYKKAIDAANEYAEDKIVKLQKQIKRTEVEKNKEIERLNKQIEETESTRDELKRQINLTAENQARKIGGSVDWCVKKLKNNQRKRDQRISGANNSKCGILNAVTNMPEDFPMWAHCLSPEPSAPPSP